MLKFVRSIIIFTIAALAIILAVNAFAQEQKPVEIITFHQQGCSYCALQDKFFNENLKKNYNVKITKYELIDEPANIQLLEALSAVYGHAIEGTPTLFVGDKVFSGHDGNIELAIIAEVNRCLVDGCESPLIKLKDYNPDGEPVSVDEKFKKIGYVVIGIVGVLIIIIIAFTIKPRRKNI